MYSRRQFWLAVAAAAGCRPRRGTGFPGYVLVASQKAPVVAAVDLRNFSFARHIELGALPASLLAHPSRPLAWALAADTGALFEIDAARLRASRRRLVGRAAAMRLSPDHALLWILSRQPPQLAAISVHDFEQAGRIGLPEEPLDFDISPDGQWAAASLSGGGLVFVDLHNRRTRGPVRLGRRAGLVRFRSDGKLVLVGNADQPALSVLEVPTGAPVVHLPLAMRPQHFCFKPDGGQLFVTGPGADAVAIVYPYRTEVAETVLAGKSPGAMAVSTAPDYLFVANPESGDVAIMEIETRRVIALAPAGQGVHALTVTPDNQYVLALNSRSGTMAVIRIRAIVARRTRLAPLFTVVPVGPAPAEAVVCRL